MTYSNTNRDKTQLDRWKKLKQTLFYGILGYITYSSLSNIYRQFTTLRLAETRLKVLEKKVQSVDTEKKKYLRLVEEATSSATISRNQRQYFGIGTDKDYWLIIPSPQPDENIVTEINEEKTVPNLVKWWNLFTK
jgi:hypothetical protein